MDLMYESFLYPRLFPHNFLVYRECTGRRSLSSVLFYLNKSECEPVLTKDNTNTSSIF